MAEADDDLLLGDAFDDVGFSIVRVVVTPDGVEGELIGAAVLRTLERADCATDCRIHVGARAGDDACRKCGRVELVFGIEDQRGMHRPLPKRSWLSAMQEVQEMTADGIVIGLDVDAPSRM